MKKVFFALVTLCLLLALTGCIVQGAPNGSTAPSATPGTSAQPDATGGSLSLGMYVQTELGGADAAEDGNGTVEVDSTVAAVLLDGEGRIVDCVIDVAQSKLELTSAGAVLNKESDLPTKREQGNEYGMAGRSGIGKEWYEQAAGFCEYVIGKTAGEVGGIALDETGAPTDEELRATTTIKIGEFIDAVTGACERAAAVDAGEGDRLGLGVYTTLAESVDATADGNGRARADSTYIAVAVDADGLVSAAVADATQAVVGVSGSGAIITDLAAVETPSKQEQGDEYGMRPRSGIGLEWYEQAGGFCRYIIGKTGDEIGGIAIGEDGTAQDEELRATATIVIADFVDAASRAVRDAESR